MTPEQKFKQWALDPNGGGWNRAPEPTDKDIQILTFEREDWKHQQAAFLAGMEADRWISVEERLPEEPGMYLTYSAHRGKTIVSYYSIEDMMFYDSGGTHWQPLPNKPKP